MHVGTSRRAIESMLATAVIVTVNGGVLGWAQVLSPAWPGSAQARRALGGPVEARDPHT